MISSKTGVGMPLAVWGRLLNELLTVVFILLSFLFYPQSFQPALLAPEPFGFSFPIVIVEGSSKKLSMSSLGIFLTSFVVFETAGFGLAGDSNSSNKSKSSCWVFFFAAAGYGLLLFSVFLVNFLNHTSIYFMPAERDLFAIEGVYPISS